KKKEEDKKEEEKARQLSLLAQKQASAQNIPNPIISEVKQQSPASNPMQQAQPHAEVSMPEKTSIMRSLQNISSNIGSFLCSIGTAATITTAVVLGTLAATNFWNPIGWGAIAALAVGGAGLGYTSLNLSPNKWGASAGVTGMVATAGSAMGVATAIGVANFWNPLGWAILGSVALVVSIGSAYKSYKQYQHATSNKGSVAVPAQAAVSGESRVEGDRDKDAKQCSYSQRIAPRIPQIMTHRAPTYSKQPSDNDKQQLAEVKDEKYYQTNLRLRLAEQMRAILDFSLQDNKTILEAFALNKFDTLVVELEKKQVSSSLIKQIRQLELVELVKNCCDIPEKLPLYKAIYAEETKDLTSLLAPYKEMEGVETLMQKNKAYEKLIEPQNVSPSLKPR
ncbi:MAG TPA: hypothetical protein VHA52_08785, partial [Candidatus Babeliaceae bacterium]|nr:hypothetical protein [Candidatus Babeliaceae bacterium]